MQAFLFYELLILNFQLFFQNKINDAKLKILIHVNIIRIQEFYFF